VTRRDETYAVMKAFRDNIEARLSSLACAADRKVEAEVISRLITAHQGAVVAWCVAGEMERRAEAVPAPAPVPARQRGPCDGCHTCQHDIERLARTRETGVWDSCSRNKSNECLGTARSPFAYNHWTPRAEAGS
jgi:hypothetical protein